MSSSVLSVGRVGEVSIDAAEEIGSMLAMLLRMLGTETLERVRKGHRGGSSGAVDASVGLLDRSLLARGVSVSSSADSWRGGGVVTAVLAGRAEPAAVVLGLDNGDFLSEPLRSLPLPKTAFRKDPLRLREGLDCTSAIALRLGDGLVAVLGGSVSKVSPSLVRRILRRDSMLPEIDRLCVVGDFFLSDVLGVSSSIAGNGMAASFSFDSEVDVLIMSRRDERHDEQRRLL